MADYNHRQTEQKWQRFWDENQTYKTDNPAANSPDARPKHYVLDMFPYPSGAGLHVGHPLGYIASDIVARYKRLKGFNVLHPMGFDSFGLPAEQYAIQTGQHPAETTNQNLARYTEQLKNIGFSYDWSREVRTSEPGFYRWTQWIFMELFRSWYNRRTNKAEPIETLLAHLATHGTANLEAVCDDDAPTFTAAQWLALSAEEQYAASLQYRLTYLADAMVNFCPGLGMVLSNDEVKDGPNGRVSERGGYPVEQKLMRQWMMRITAYADRLLTGLDTIDWSESLKEQQRNWIGRSVGASVRFKAPPAPEGGAEFGNSPFGAVRRFGGGAIEVFTTRVDTLYGVTFMVLAPEHELVDALTTPGQREAVDAYRAAVKLRSERDRMMDAKTVSGVFTGSYCVNPISGAEVPIWLADYVLAGYGTGAVMAVPSGDQRDYLFANQYDLPIVPVLDAQKNLDQQADNTKEGRYINSDLINGLTYQEATAKLITVLEANGAGKGKVNFRLRDAVFSRQRYWGEPVPVYFKPRVDSPRVDSPRVDSPRVDSPRVDSPTANGGVLPYLIDETDLPLELPAIDKYLPTETGEPPLGRAENWQYGPLAPKGGTMAANSVPPLGARGPFEYELSTMPGWAGSSWYWYRYMDPQNTGEFASRSAIDYWQNVDLYMGGSEHATGHLLYSRFWNKFLFDRGYVSQDEPFKKLINQGMIQGRSNFVYRLEGTGTADKPAVYVSHGQKDQYATTELHVDVNMVENDVLDLEAFRHQSAENANAEFILESDGTYLCGWAVEKMSKSKFNVVNPDDVVEKYGADVLRLYEMFLGPLEQAKPWNTNGIDGTYRFIRKLWRLFYHDTPGSDAPARWLVTDDTPTPAELKILHKTIKKAQDDIDNFSFNTSVSAFMVCVNELVALKCHKRAILQDLVLLVSPYAPHLAEELWAALGNVPGTVSGAQYPVFDPQFLVEDTFDYPVQINGKVRTTIPFALNRPTEEIQQDVLQNDVVQKWMEGKPVKKIVVIPSRIVNVVI